MTRSAILISPAVREILEASRVEADRVVLPKGPLDRKLYVEVNRILEACGGKWDRRQSSHLFTSDPRSALGIGLDSGKVTVESVVNEQQVYGIFYTPEILANKLAEELGNAAPGPRVLEPSAGTGRLADAMGSYGADVTCVEIRLDAATALTRRGFLTTCADFLTCTCEGLGGPFDAVLMNPPFAKNQDIQHVEHAYEMLRPGGKLVAIMSPGFAVGTTGRRAAFRDRVTADGARWEELSPNTFRESGTDVRAVVLYWDKTP